MKRSILILLIISCNLVSAQNFTLKSNSLKGQAENDLIFNGMGCVGGNISPQLSWEGIPENTKSFAITIHDPDAPTVSGWWHWVVFNIPSNVTELVADAGNIEKNIAPQEAIQSITDFGTYGYGGPCPPQGDSPHQYIITVYALDIDKIELDKDASAAMVTFYLHQHTIQKASLIFYSKR